MQKIYSDFQIKLLQICLRFGRMIYIYIYKSVYIIACKKLRKKTLCKKIL